MTALIIIGGIILFFALLLSLSLKITVAYRDELSLVFKVLFIRIRILPKKDKRRGPHSMSKRRAAKIKQRLEKKAAKKRAKKEAKKKEKAILAEGGAKKEKRSVSEILDIISMVKEIVGTVIKKFFGHLKIDAARIKIKVATGDAASTAIAYGAVSQSVNLLLPVLEDVKNFKLPRESQFDISADFLSDKPEIDIKLTFSVRLWHIFDIAFAALGKFIKRKAAGATDTDHKIK